MGLGISVLRHSPDVGQWFCLTAVNSAPKPHTPAPAPSIHMPYLLYSQMGLQSIWFSTPSHSLPPAQAPTIT